MKTSISQGKRCPLCNKIAKPSMGKLSSYWYCTECELGWIKRIPNTTYVDEYYTSGSSLLSKVYKPLETFFYKLRARKTGLNTKQLYIDVGAGDGTFLATVYAKKRIGVEISKSGRKTMEKKGLDTMTNTQYLKTKNLKADVISYWQVAEHVTKPWEYFFAAHNNLKRSGKIVVAVPNISSFEFHHFGKYWFHLAPLYHIWHFSPKSLTKMLEQQNFTIERIDYWALEHHFTGILQTFINKTSGSEDVLHKLIKRRQDLSKLQVTQLFWILFWCTVGLPLVLLFWIVASLLKKSGNFTVVATKK